ncbi:MAG: NAD(+) diphosphatase [Defluviitaleaceae bacterium]|nr:NAD(+) diphosphatase [Defluviitaleaceae bacterium]
MLQDIKPHILNNKYEPRPPASGDYVLIYHNRQAVLKDDKLPLFCELESKWQINGEDLTYLFCVDGVGFYLVLQEVLETEHFKFYSIQTFRKTIKPEWLLFASITAAHLALWYDVSRHCGKCAAPTVKSPTERAILCPKCELTLYPQIFPVVIVGITDGDKILLTKYASGHDRYALVAGYVEIGETLEDAVKRETMEEVGLELTNIRYYKSQPWAFSGSLLMGFFADADSKSLIKLDKDELSEATWFHREHIPKDGDPSISLTWDMIEAFRHDQSL